MPISITCPECDARLNLRVAPAAGARLKCPKCSKQFAFSNPDEAEPAAASKKSGISAGSPARRRRDPDDDDESETPRSRSKAREEEPDDEEEERKPSKKKKKKAKAGSNNGLIIGLVAGGVGLVVLGLVAVGIVFILKREKPGGAQQAKVAAPEQVPKAGPLQPVNNNNGNPKQVVAPPPRNNNNPKPIATGPMAAPLLHKKVNVAELYGDQGGEAVAKADGGLPSALMRARRDDTFIKLSNPREGEVTGPGVKGKGTRTVQALLLDYVIVRRGKFDGGKLVIHTEDGGRAEVDLKQLVAGRDQGTIQLVGVVRVGIFKKQQVTAKTEFPKNAEFYVIRGDDRYVPPAKFIVSNSAVMGALKVTTQARDWTAEEIDRYGNPPPAYHSPNLQPPTFGEDVPPLNGWLWKSRYVEPEGRLLGLDYRLGKFAKEDHIMALVPIFSHDQPTSQRVRELARPGYAVAGAEVNVRKGGSVFGIRLLFRRVKTDGSLDAADAYQGQWIGAPAEGAPTVLVNDGRRVMGMTIQARAVVEFFSLVVAR